MTSVDLKENAVHQSRVKMRTFSTSLSLIDISIYQLNSFYFYLLTQLIDFLSI